LAFSYRSCRHPHLHSFPTRRSSDLTMFAADIRYVLQRAKLLSELDDLTALYNTRGFAIAADRLFGQALRYTRPASVLMVDLDNRSEEHTSELQSRVDLVCRLLLEKK